MKLLILTQKIDINDDVLGFFHDWVEELAKHCEKITVIALGVGEYDLPDKAKVLSLGKEQGRSRLKYILNFYRHIWRERKNYDKVLVHMNVEYVILGGLAWRLLRKKVSLWYVHKRVDLKLRLAEKIVNVIFTASRESFGLKSAKLKIVGHGVDLNKFTYQPRANHLENFKIIYVGRISRIKNQELLIEAINILVHPVKSPLKRGAEQFNGVNVKGLKNVKVDLIGSPIYPEDKAYQEEIINLIKNYRLENQVNFRGSVPNKDIAREYGRADLSVNLCSTGGMDKAVLESMAVGLPVIVYNKTFSSLLAEHNDLLLKSLDAGELAGKITELMNLSPEQRRLIGLNLRKKIVQDYSLTNLINKIVNQLTVK